MKDNEVIAPVTGTPGMFLFHCPGCKCGHGVWTETPNELTAARWTWNGDKVKPTFNPSILVTGTRFKSEESVEQVDGRCHSFVRDGMIQFLSDCSHELAGKTVPLNPL